MVKVAALVPLKLNSRRLPNKNFLRLGDRPLAYHIFSTLVEIDAIGEVFSYASQPQIMSLLPEGVRFLARPPRLDGDAIKGNELFRYAVERIDADIIVLCHATSPYISGATILDALEKVKSGEYDCAAAVRKLQTYCWFEGKPLNYDPLQMAQTQDLSSVYAETSGVYIFKKSDYLQSNSRINGRVHLVEVDEREAVDIDHPEDFNLALQLLDYDADDNRFSKDRFFIDHVNAQARNKNVGLICFDLDGVLIDSLPAMESAWSRASAEFGISVPFEDYAKYIGFPFKAILQRLQIAEELWDKLDESYNRYAIERQGDIHVYPDIVDSLLRLSEAGIKLAIATSKGRQRTKAIVDEKFGGVPFSMVVTPEDVKPQRGKPNPDQLLQAALAAGVDPSNSLYVGDMEVDKIAAKRAGFQFIHAGWGYGSISGTDNIWFNSMADFMEFIVLP